MSVGNGRDISDLAVTTAAFAEGLLSLRTELAQQPIGDLAIMHADSVDQAVGIGRLIELAGGPTAELAYRQRSYGYAALMAAEAADRQDPTAQPPHSAGFWQTAVEAHGQPVLDQYYPQNLTPLS